MAISLWLSATIALAVAIPANWAQHTLFDAGGYTELAREAGTKPGVRDATAAILTERVTAVARDRGFRGGDAVIQQATSAYTSSPSFPSQFADVNRIAHQWLFTNNARQTDGGWQVDVGPMLADTSFKSALTGLGVDVPATITVPVTSDNVGKLRPGQLRPLATWGPWVSTGTAILAAVVALLMLLVAKGRSKALAALGVSALIVAGGGWALLAAGRGRIDSAMSKTNGNVHTITDALVVQAENSLQSWLTYTLIAGGALVVVGVLLAVIGSSMRRRKTPAYPVQPVGGYQAPRPPMEPTQPPSI
jgi:hypothetical protein